MRKLFKERKLFKGGNYMRKYGMFKGNYFFNGMMTITQKNAGKLDFQHLMLEYFSH